MRVSVPNGGSPSEYLSFGLTLAQLPEAQSYEIDFANVEFVTPGWMISVGDALRRFRSIRPNSKRAGVNYKGKQCLQYAAHAGFFKSFGMNYGQGTGAARSTERFLPVTSAQADEVRSRAYEGMQHHGDVVQSDSERLVSVLTQQDGGEVFEVLSYSLREIVRNVIEHSRSETYAYAAQYWPGNGEAELVVSDSGIGLLKSLRKNPRLSVGGDEEALRLAVEPGITSVAKSTSRRDGDWGNSGYGLYMTRRLCDLGGCFSLASGSRALLSTDHGTKMIETDGLGTTVILRLASHKIGDLGDRLRQFRDAASRSDRKPSGASVSTRVHPRKPN